MPKLKPSATEMMNREVRASLAFGQAQRGMDDLATSKCLGTCKVTYQRRKRNPETMSVAELRSLIRIFKIPDDAIVRMLKEG